MKANPTCWSEVVEPLSGRQRTVRQVGPPARLKITLFFHIVNREIDALEQARGEYNLDVHSDSAKMMANPNANEVLSS